MRLSAAEAGPRSIQEPADTLATTLPAADGRRFGACRHPPKHGSPGRFDPLPRAARRMGWLASGRRARTRRSILRRAQGGSRRKIASGDPAPRPGLSAAAGLDMPRRSPGGADRSARDRRCGAACRKNRRLPPHRVTFRSLGGPQAATHGNAAVARTVRRIRPGRPAKGVPTVMLEPNPGRSGSRTRPGLRSPSPPSQTRSGFRPLRLCVQDLIRSSALPRTGRMVARAAK